MQKIETNTIHHPTYLAKLNELDAKRTPGNWQLHSRPDDEINPGSVFSEELLGHAAVAMQPRYSHKWLNGDGAFIAESPNFLAAYRDLLGVAQELAAALKKQNDYGFHMAAWDHDIIKKALSAASARGLGEE